jgi:hypothetical protein
MACLCPGFTLFKAQNLEEDDSTNPLWEDDISITNQSWAISIFDYDEDDYYGDSYDSLTSRDDILAIVHHVITTADNPNDSPSHLHSPP